MFLPFEKIKFVGLLNPMLDLDSDYMFSKALNNVDQDEENFNYSSMVVDAFQIDGNFGGAAAVVEMLMQSSDNRIHLLPALPDAWQSGSISGICARGGFEVSMTWDNGILKKIKIHSKVGGSTTLICGNKQKQISLKKGESIELVW